MKIGSDAIGRGNVYLLISVHSQAGAAWHPDSQSSPALDAFRHLDAEASHYRLSYLASPGSNALDWLRNALLSRQVVSAAIIAEMPPPSRRWIASEWHGQLVIERGLVNHVSLVHDEWHVSGSFENEDLVILSPAEPSAADRADRFCSGLHSHVPLLERVPATALDEDPSIWFGNLAGESLGGWVALSCAADDVRKDPVVIGNPAAFGFVFDDAKPSLPFWIRASVVAAEVEAISPDAAEQRCDASTRLPEGVPPPSGWRERGWHFALKLTMRGVKDPGIAIDTGIIFEQPRRNGMQNLAVAAGTRATVNAGQTITAILPAWCLNPGAATPRGPLRPTPLAYPHGGSGSQRAVWDEIEQRRQRYR